MGSGAALLDYDGDGDLDVYLVSANSDLGLGPEPGRFTNHLYRQGEGGRFEDVTEASGLGDRGYGMGVAVGDYDNDGHEDVYVANFGEDHLYRNLGDGTFEDV
ncbi:MAG: VCBS repeat-containing protein, partial [Acidobacteria bacterium]|nr:VCBS repeat-containing protein [Acidobacteriota bacterium]